MSKPLPLVITYKGGKPCYTVHGVVTCATLHAALDLLRPTRVRKWKSRVRAVNHSIDLEIEYVGTRLRFGMKQS